MKKLALMILAVIFIVGCTENKNDNPYDLKVVIRTPEDKVLRVTAKRFCPSGNRVYILANDGTKYCTSIDNVLLVEEPK